MQDEWRMWRHAFVGHAGAKGLYQIMQQSYSVPESPPASELGTTATAQTTAEFRKKNQELWFLLAQATKGAAAMLVMRFEEPTPDGRSAWLELERVYGGRAEDERAAQLLKLEAKARRLTCESAGGLQQMLIQMEQLWSDLETLGEIKSKSAKRATLLEAIRESYPHLFAQLAIQSNLDYEMLKRAIISAASFEQFESEEKQSSLALNAQGRKQAPTRSSRASNASTRLQADQCAFCLKRGHRWRECRNYLSGGRPAQRPSTMQQPDFPPPPSRTNNHSNRFASSNRPSPDNRDTGSSAGRSFLALHAFGEETAAYSSAVGTFTDESTWVIDSGANMHMTPDSSCMVNRRPTTKSCTFGDGKRIQADHVGDVVLQVSTDHTPATIVLQDVLHIPSLPFALLSTAKLRSAGGTFVDSAKRGSYLQLPDGRRIPLEVDRDTNFLQLHGQYSTAGSEQSATAYASLSNRKSRLTLLQWHTVLGHLHPAAIKHLEKRGLIEISDATTVSDFHCSTCKECKSEALSFARGGRTPKVEPGEVVHTDLEGPFKTDVNGFKYFQIFVDEATRDKRVVGLRTKDAAVAATKSYLDTMQQSDIYVKCLSGDGAGELGRSGKFQRMLTERHVRWRKSPPYTPQANGLAERGIKSLMYSARSSLSRSGRGERFWFFAVADAAYKSSGMPHEYLGGETPHERLTGKPFNYDRLRAFGTECYVHQFKQQRGSSSKFHPYAKRGFIVGHDRASTAWHVWLTAEEKMVTSAHVTFTPEEDALDFLESAAIIDLSDNTTDAAEQQQQQQQQDFSTSDVPSSPSQETATIDQQQNHTSESISTRTAPRSSKLVKPTPRYLSLQDLPEIPRKAKSSIASAETDNVARVVQRLSQSDEAFCFIALHSVVPTSTDEPSLQEAMNSDYAKEWQEAIDTELAGMWEKGVFSDVPMPPDRKPVGTKFVLKIKRNADGTIERFKARLVAQGFSQQQGIDYGQTFSPVVATDVLRTILALAAAKSWDVQALDFTQAYLNADIDADLWVRLPDNKVVKVEKALYGFKQSALQWYEELRTTITTVEGWQPSQYDDCLYYKVSKDGKIAILVTYVDDLVFTGDYNTEIQRMKQSLLKTYKGRDIGTPDQLFGVHITVDSSEGITLDQSRYAADIVSGILGSLDVRTTTTPIDPGMDISATRSDDIVLDTSYMYSHHIGKLMYLAGMTRPDLSNAVRELGRRASSPCMRHWRALQHVARYLAGTLSISMKYFKSNSNLKDVLVGYSDSDWATDPETRRSVTGYILLFDNSPIAWKSKSQTSITCSSSEAEWTAMAHGMRHAVHLRGLLAELTLPQQTSTWHEDNQGALRAGTIIGFTGRTRHVDVQLKITREYILRGHFKVMYTSTSDQLADALTKRLTGPKLQKFVQALLWTK